MKEYITPKVYEEMNEQFIEEGLGFRIKVPTQEQLDEYFNQTNEETTNEDSDTPAG